MKQENVSKMEITASYLSSEHARRSFVSSFQGEQSSGEREEARQILSAQEVVHAVALARFGQHKLGEANPGHLTVQNFHFPISLDVHVYGRSKTCSAFQF